MIYQRMYGESMAPVLRAGDIVVCKEIRNWKKWLLFGHIYLISFVSDRELHTTVKYLYKSDVPGYYTLRSEHEGYAPVEILIENIRSVAIVKTSIRHHIWIK